MPYADPEKYKEYQSRYQTKYLPRRNALARAKRAALSPDEKEAALTSRRARYAQNSDVITAQERARLANIDPALRSAAKRMKRYGLTQDKYDAMLKEQGGLCALCQTKPPPQTSTTAMGGVMSVACSAGHAI